MNGESPFDERNAHGQSMSPLTCTACSGARTDCPEVGNITAQSINGCGKQLEFARVERASNDGGGHGGEADWSSRSIGIDG